MLVAIFLLVNPSNTPSSTCRSRRVSSSRLCAGFQLVNDARVQPGASAGHRTGWFWPAYPRNCVSGECRKPCLDREDLFRVIDGAGHYQNRAREAFFAREERVEFIPVVPAQVEVQENDIHGRAIQYAERLFTSTALSDHFEVGLRAARRRPRHSRDNA